MSRVMLVAVLGVVFILASMSAVAEQVQLQGPQAEAGHRVGRAVPYFDYDLSIRRREVALYGRHVARATHRREDSSVLDKSRHAMLSLGGPLPIAASSALASKDAADEVLPGLPGSLVAVMEGGVPLGKRGSPIKSLSELLMAPVSTPASMSIVPKAASPASAGADILQAKDLRYRGLFLPFEIGVGAAAFAKGSDVYIVFDKPRPLDLSAVQANFLGRRCSIQLLPEATVLRLAGHDAGSVSLRRLPAGWLVQDGSTPHITQAIEPLREGASLRFGADQPGRTVVVPDPITGAKLLIGTIRAGSSKVLNTRLESALRIDQTIAGLVLEPLGDMLELRSAADAFILSGMAPNALAMVNTPGSTQDSVVLPLRIMSLDPGSIEVLKRRLDDARADAGAAPAGARFLPRLRAAEAALALGDGITAATIIHVAIADEPRAAAQLRPRLVARAAALLNHRPDQAGASDDLGSNSTGEPALWRAVMLAEQDPHSQEAAHLFSANLALLEAYPQPLQAILLPLAAETMVRAGTDVQAHMILLLPQAPSLEFARALLDERRGEAASALSALDRLANSPDWVLGDQAAEELTTIREKSAGADPAQLANFLESRLLDARIAGHEPESLLHLADLRMRAGQWQIALDLLREVAHRYPEREPVARRRIAEVLRRLITAPSDAGASGLVNQAALIEGNSDLLPSGQEGAEVSMFLTAKLAALDLPEQAARIIRRMMQTTPPGIAREELGLRLAKLDLQQHDLAGAQAALKESESGNTPPPLAASRAVMMARALADGGQLDQALSAITSLHTDAALDLKARLYAQRQDWTAAADCLAALTRQRLARAAEPDGEDGDLLLRLAAAVSRTGDMARLEQARVLGSRQWSSAAKQALFQTLTSDPGSAPLGLDKAAAELEQIRSSSAAIQPTSQ